MDEAIVRALKNACGNKNIKFQVIVRQNQLYIYVNRRQNFQIDYQWLTKNVTVAIANLNLDLNSAWLFSRPIGEFEPDWQTQLELPQVVALDDAPTKGSSNVADLADLENIPTDSSISAFEVATLKSQSELGTTQDFATDELPKFDFEPEDNDLGDTGLLHEAGLVHGTHLKEEPIELSASLNELQASNLEEENDTLGQYCFISNEKLLTMELAPPPKEIVRLVKFFHYLDDRQRSQLLPILHDYFRGGKRPDLSQQSSAIRGWFKQMGELKEEDWHNAAIWLSRYCVDRKKTLIQFKNLATKTAEAAVQKKTKAPSSETAYSFTPANNRKKAIAEAELISQPKFQLPSRIKKLLLPAVWIFVTSILLIFGILSNDAPSVAERQVANICRNSLGDPQACNLAVALAGKNIARSPKNFVELTEVTQTYADYGCQRYANLKAGVATDKIDPQVTPVVSKGIKIFPHIYVVDARQKNVRQPGDTRVGCVYTTGKGEQSPKKLAADVIPLNWSEEGYQQETTDFAWGKFSKPINLGLSTTFAALGIAIASGLNLGIKTARASTVYLVALFLGFTQLLSSVVPVFGLLVLCVAPILAILVANKLIAGFQLDWSRGYSSIAIGIVIIVAVQLSFNTLFQQLLINSF